MSSAHPHFDRALTSVECYGGLFSYETIEGVQMSEGRSGGALWVYPLPASPIGPLGPTYCTPEIDNSEIIVDFQGHFPMDVQWYFPTKFHLSVVFPKGLSLSQWFVTGNCRFIFSVFPQWKFTCVSAGV